MHFTTSPVRGGQRGASFRRVSLRCVAVLESRVGAWSEGIARIGESCAGLA